MERDMDITSLKERLTQARALHPFGSMTLGDMYQAAGTGKLLGNWTHDNQLPNMSTLKKLAQGLDVSLTYLVKPSPPLKKPSKERRLIAQPIGKERDTGNRFHLLLKVWENEHRRASNELFHALDRMDLLDWVFVIGEDSDVLWYDWIGPNYRHTLGQPFLLGSCGRQLGEFELDKSFTSWCETTYRAAFADKEPRRELCSVVSHETGQGLEWIYERLILPCRNGQEWILLVINWVR